MPYQFDHRRLAEDMELCFFDSHIGAGLPVWLPHGVAIRESLEKWIRPLEDKMRCLRVVSPHLGAAELFRGSGHLDHFAENMFPPMQWEGSGRSYYLKPMNCPHHHRVFGSRVRSYRDLPFRIAEYGQVYRFEDSGCLRGLSRVRGLCQNDGHHYIEPEQSLSEVMAILEMFERAYQGLGLKGYRYRLSLSEGSAAESLDGPGEFHPQARAEEVLRRALEALGLKYYEARGEAAFYGPKVDVQMRIGENREESIASVQLDWMSGARLGLQYSDREGVLRAPWVVHRAPLGSHERFIAALLEYFDGQLPGWLAPVQVLVLPVVEEHMAGAQRLVDELAASRSGGHVEPAQLRVKVLGGPGGLSKRLVLGRRWRPFSILVVGDRELRQGRFRVQLRGENLEIERWNLRQVLEARVQPP